MSLKYRCNFGSEQSRPRWQVGIRSIITSRIEPYQSEVSFGCLITYRDHIFTVDVPSDRSSLLYHSRQSFSGHTHRCSNVTIRLLLRHHTGGTFYGLQKRRSK